MVENVRVRFCDFYVKSGGPLAYLVRLLYIHATLTQPAEKAQVYD
jgi:hypothetical protein